MKLPRKPPLPSGTRRWALYGALLGLALAITVEVWRQHAYSRVQGEALEGVWLTAATWAVGLGFPVNIVMIELLEILSPIFADFSIDLFFVLLIGIVANWAMWGAVLGQLIRTITRHRASVGR